jgi:hypothetical protein
VTIEADLLAIDHVRDADDAHEGHRESDEDGISQMRSFLVGSSGGPHHG